MNAEESTGLYLDLMKRVLTGTITKDPAAPVAWRPQGVYDERRRYGGRDWPLHAHTMIGMTRLDNLQYLCATVIRDGVPGDFIETGVWRGGACIFMRALLKAYQITNRTVWCADSFVGFPREQERDDDRMRAGQPDQKFLSVPMGEVMGNFELYNLLDDQVKFIKGYFNRTLPGPVKRLAILRLDGDLYSSTMDALVALYPLLETGGYCIIDDWNESMCRDAVTDYRRENGITSLIQGIDGMGVYWRKGS